jgi:hypothetical protein
MFFYLPISFAFAENTKTTLNRCDATSEKTEISIKSTDQGFKVNHQYTTTNLNTKSLNSFSGDFVVGLTSLESKTVIDIEGPMWEDKSKEGECFAAKIRIQLIYQPIKVYIGSEFTEGSCIYNTILEHEMQHVVIYRDNLLKIENLIKDLMEKRFAGKPIYAAKNSSKRFLDNEIDELWRPLIKSEFAKVQIQQNELDSDDNLDKLSWACLGEIQRKFGYRFQ